VDVAGTRNSLLTAISPAPAENAYEHFSSVMTTDRERGWLDSLEGWSDQLWRFLLVSCVKDAERSASFPRGNPPTSSTTAAVESSGSCVVHLAMLSRSSRKTCLKPMPLQLNRQTVVT